MKCLPILLLFASPALCQTIELQGGASSLYQAQGGGIVLYEPGFTTTASAGIFQGRLVGSAATQFALNGWTIDAGDKQIFFNSGAAGISAANRGVLISRKRKNSEVAFFAGAVGRASTVPFFAGLAAKHFGAGFTFTHAFGRGLSYGTIQATAGNLHTSMQDIAWRWRALKLSESAGLLENKSFANGQALIKFRHFAATISRTDYIFQNQSAGVTNEGFAALLGPLDLHASAFQSKGVPGETAGGGLRLGLLSVRGDEFWAAQGRTFSGSISQQVGRHFRLSQYLNRSNGQTTFSAGGAFQSNWLSASLDHTVLYSLFTGKFQNATVVTLSFRLHDTAVNLGTVNGKWTSYASEYIQTGLQLAGETRHAGLSGHVVAGFVRDENGAAVEGAALEIGGRLLFSNAEGYFEARFRKTKPVAVRIRPEDFVAGTWRLLSAPFVATPGDSQPIVVVVRLSH